MLLLLFEIKESRYVVDAGTVVEVIPKIKCKPVPLTPDFVLGIINYRGKAIPVIDLCFYHLGIPCENRLSTRIIIVNHIRKDFKNVHVGIVAERVTDTLHVTDQDIHKKNILIGLNFDSPEQEGTTSMVQWYDIDSLLTEKLLDTIVHE